MDTSDGNKASWPGILWRDGWHCFRRRALLACCPHVFGKRVWAAVALVVVCCCLVSFAGAEASSVSQLDQKLRSVRGELYEVRAQLQKAALAKKAAKGDIAALDKQITQAELEVEKAEAARDKALARLALLREQLDELTTRLILKRQELAETEGDLAAQQRLLEQRLVDVYKSNQAAVYLDTLLGSGSIADLVGRARLLGQILHQDSALLSRVKALKANLEEQKQALQEQQAKVAVLKSQQEAVTATLEAALEERQAALEELEAAREAKKKVLLAIQKDEAAWRAQEEALLAESEQVTKLLREAQAAVQKVAKGKGILAWPVSGPVVSGFGYRIHPIFHVRKMHTGVDIDAALGTPVKAAAAGTVVSAGWRGGYGKCVVVSHSGGLATLYGHLSELSVGVGQKIKKGEVIGKVGSTGYSTGPHLHFEVRVNGDPVDPLGYL